MLRPWISAAFDTEKTLYQRVVSNPDVVGNVLNEMYATRFGLSPLDLQLVRDNVAAPTFPLETAVTQWGQYVRFLFEPHHFYKFNGLSSGDRGRLLFVAANRSLPNRDGKYEGDAVGRDLSIIWFEEAGVDNEGGDTVVRPCCGDDGRLSIVMGTIAEISRAAGHNAPVTIDTTEREHEIMHESKLLDHHVTVCGGSRLVHTMGDGIVGADWSFILSS